MIDCLVKVKGDVRDLMVDVMNDLLSKDKGIGFHAVYEEMVKLVEVDYESAAQIYMEAGMRMRTEYDGITDSLTSDEDIDAFINSQIVKTQKEANSDVNIINKDINFQRENTAKHIAKIIVKALDNKLFPTTTNMTAARQVRDAMISYAKSIIGTQAKAGMTPEAMLSKAIYTMQLDPSKDNNFGAVGMEKLWEALKPAVETIANGISKPSIRAQFLHEIKKIQEESLNMGITKTNRKKILYDLIAKYKDKNGNTPYAKVLGVKQLEQEKKLKEQEIGATIESVQRWYNDEYKKRFDNKGDGPKIKIVANMDKVLMTEDPVAELGKILDQEMDNRKVDPALRKKIYNALVKDYTEVRAADVTASTFATQLSVHQDTRARLNDEIAISNGFTKFEGSRRVVDYSNNKGKAWLRDALKLAEDPALKGWAKDVDTATPQKVQELIGRLVSEWIKGQEVEQINAALRRIMSLNNREYKAKVRTMDRLVRMNQEGYGLDALTRGIAASVLEISLKPEYIIGIKEIAKQFEELMKAPALQYDAMSPEMMAKYGPEWQEIRSRLPQFHSLGNQAMISNEKIVVDASLLIAKAVRANDWMSVHGLIQAVGKLQRVWLVSVLMNFYNAAQNFFHAQHAILTSGPDYKGRGFWGKEKDFFKLAYSIAIGDISGLSDSEIRRTTDSETIYYYNSPIGKLLGAIKAYVEGILTGIDAAGIIVTHRNRFYAMIQREIEARDFSKSDKAKFLKEYEYLSSSGVAFALAEKYLAAAGIRKDYKPKTYKRMLKREAENIEQGFWMGSRMNELLSPESALGYYHTALGTTKTSFGKDDPTRKIRANKDAPVTTIPAGIPNLPQWLMKGIAQNENRIQDEVLEGKRGKGGLVWMSLLHRIMAGGIMPYAPGAWRFFNFSASVFPTVVRGAARGVYNQTAGRLGAEKKQSPQTRYENELRAMIASRGTGIENEQDKQMLAHNIEIMRMYNRQAISTLLVTGVYIMAALAASDDDDEGDAETQVGKIVNRVLHQSYEWAYNPFVRKVLTRVAPVLVRFIAGYAEGKHRRQGGPKVLENSPLGKGIGYAVSTRVPSSFIDILEMFERDGWKATTGKILGASFFGVGNVAWPIQLFYNQIYKEGIKGEKPPFSVKDNPLMRGITEDEFINGFFGGALGTGSTMFINSMYGRKSNVHQLPLVGDTWEAWKDIPYEQLVQDFKGKNIKDIPWSTYGLEDIYKKRDDIQKAYNSLDALKTKIIAIADTWGIEEMDSENDLRQWWENPNIPFTVPAPEGVSPEALKRNFGVTINDSGNVNILAAAANKIGLKDLDIQDFTNALKFKLLQERL